MKKLVLFTLLFVSMFTLAACDNSEGSEKTDVVVIIPGTLGDKSYFDGINASMATVLAEFDDKMTLKFIEAGFETENWEPTIYDSADAGYDIVITVSPDLATLLQSIAPKYPDTVFLHIDGTVDYDTYDLPNVATVETPPAQPSFLAGAMAAMQSVDGQLGFVGGMDILPIHEFLVPFLQGALYVNPDIEVAVGWTNDWSDSAAGKAIADVQVANGADVLFAAAGGAGLGIFDTALENSGVLTIGVDSDQYAILKDVYPAKAATVVSSLVKGLTPVLEELFTLYFNDNFPVGVRTAFLLEHHGMYMVDNENYQLLMSAEDQAKLLKIEADIVSGDIIVKDVYTMTAQEIADYITTVAPTE